MNFYWGWFISHIVVSVVVSGFHQDNPNDQMSLKISYIQKKKNAIPKSPKTHGKWWLASDWIQQSRLHRALLSRLPAIASARHGQRGEHMKLRNCASTDLNKTRKYIYIYTHIITQIIDKYIYIYISISLNIHIYIIMYI